MCWEGRFPVLFTAPPLPSFSTSRTQKIGHPGLPNTPTASSIDSKRFKLIVDVTHTTIHSRWSASPAATVYQPPASPESPLSFMYLCF